MNKLSIALLLALIIISSVPNLAYTNVRLRFARGRTSATVAGKVNRGGRVCYVAAARQGQTLTATVSSQSGNTRIFESGETSYTLRIDLPGDQSICVDNLGDTTKYTLSVSIR